MAAQGEYLENYDFSGGLNSNDPESLVADNQAIDLRNINLLDRGFEKRRGDSAFNSSAMVSGSTAIVGLGYMKYNSGTEFLNAVAGATFQTSSGLTGTMTNKTGAVTITSAQSNFWYPVNFNDLQIWFGGAPDAPFKYDGGAGNAAALGGSPPSARFVFGANNRIFGLSTSANPSRIFWPILSNPEDWTGTGSGNADVTVNDGEALQCGVVLDTDTAILFKNSSTHVMFLTRAPFPIFQLQRGIGIAGRNAFVNVNGTIFFITPSRRMKSTRDGSTFQDYPSWVDDLWDGTNSDNIPYIQGVYYQALEQIIWTVASGSSTKNNIAIIWDLRRKCWLYHPTGFDCNVMAIIQNRRLFAGHYDGKIYEKDKSGILNDASETSPGAIEAYWRSKWFAKNGPAGITHPHWIDHVVTSQTVGSFDASYGFDFVPDQSTSSFSQTGGSSLWDTALWDTATWGGETSLVGRQFVYGRGNYFNVKIGNDNESEPLVYQGYGLQMRPSRARKVLQGT